MKILFVADIFARPGRRVAAALIPELVRERGVDLVVANGENAAGGFGLTDKIARKLHTYGADVITSGNHVWDRSEFIPYLAKTDRVLRPFNYPEAPGIGSVVLPTRNGTAVAVLNLQGRTGLPNTECPFRTGRAEVERLRAATPLVFVDFHAEATAEKVAMGLHLDGLATAVVGAHTHVQTADERILPRGTAYLTDAGMTGVQTSVIGVRPQMALQRFLTQIPTRFKPAEGSATLCGALVEADPANGCATRIERLRLNEP